MTAPRLILISLAILAVLPVATAAQKIDSVSPSGASPGDEVVLTGGPFPADVRVVLGEKRVTPRTAHKNRLRFVVPDLPKGTYVLGLQDGERRIDSSLSLQISIPAPQITDVEPRKVDNCDKEKQTPITVSGKHFAEGSRVLLDGAALASERRDDELVFTLPKTVTGGQHEIVVANPDRRTSLAEALQVQTQPEIYSVSQGTDHVSSYEVVITGRNFLYSSTLVVNGRRINNLPHEAASPPQSDHVRYIDCQKLIYMRYPYSRELHDVRLQIVNPGGEQSAVMSVAIP